MVKVIRLSFVGLFLCMTFAFVAPVPRALAADVIAVIQQMKGKVEVERAGDRREVAQGYGLEVSDVVFTGDEAAAGLKFTDGAEVALGAGTRFVLESYEYDSAEDRGSFESSIARGSLSIRSGRIAKKGRDRMRVRTPTTVLGVRGTYFLVKVDPGE